MAGNLNNFSNPDYYSQLPPELKALVDSQWAAAAQFGTYPQQPVFPQRGQGTNPGGDSGGGSQTPAPNPSSTSTTPLDENNPLVQMLRRIGVTGEITGPAPSVNPITGATLNGPNPMITAPFRHLFNQEQVDKYAQKTPSQVSTLSPSGNYTTTSVDWWKPLTDAVGTLAGEGR